MAAWVIDEDFVGEWVLTDRGRGFVKVGSYVKQLRPSELDLARSDLLAA